MKFWEAMKALEEGKRVRCKRWPPASEHTSDIGNPIGGFWIDNMMIQITVDRKDYESEWELYEEPEHTLSFAEVVKGLKEGKRFRRLFMKSWIGQEHLPCLCFKIEDYEATDWVEVKE